MDAYHPESNNSRMTRVMVATRTLRATTHLVGQDMERRWTSQQATPHMN